jgi:hypothetical protein
MEEVLKEVVVTPWWLLVAGLVTLFLYKELTMGICTCSNSLHNKVRID